MAKGKHPFENGEQVEGNILDVGGYVGVDPRFQTDPKVLKQSNPFADGADLEDEDDEDDEDEKEVPKSPAAPKVSAPAPIPAPGSDK